tara:strand:- start:1361 stop:1558 length:198 start_codon:yes stop_codon:yes gene_type:complete
MAVDWETVAAGVDAAQAALGSWVGEADVVEVEPEPEAALTVTETAVDWLPWALAGGLILVLLVKR